MGKRGQIASPQGAEQAEPAEQLDLRRWRRRRSGSPTARSLGLSFFYGMDPTGSDFHHDEQLSGPRESYVKCLLYQHNHLKM